MKTKTSKRIIYGIVFIVGVTILVLYYFKIVPQNAEQLFMLKPNLEKSKIDYESLIQIWVNTAWLFGIIFTVGGALGVKNPEFYNE